MALTVKEQDNPLIYNSLKICGNLSDDNFEQLELVLRQVEAKGKLSLEDIRNILEICPVLIEGMPPRTIFMWKQFKACLDAKAPLIEMIAYGMPKQYEETLRDVSDELKETFNDQLNEWSKRIFG